ncbi:hypothetical protein B0H13DRAFT_2336764 [Mycena leptocephala]|nr:hypothetical protein B0H13DRAFT_2336764 [Mycena leptocephala]
MHGRMDTFRWAMVYLAFVQKAKNAVATLGALRRLADIHMSLEDEETALHLFHAVLEGGTKMDIHRLRAECMVGIGDIMRRRSNSTQAKEMWETAHPLFVRSSRLKDAASVKKRLDKLSHQVNSHSLLAMWDGVVDESMESVSGVLKCFDSDTAAVQASLEKLETLSAPKSALLRLGKISADPGRSY